MEYRFKALKLNEEIGNKRGIAAATCNIGSVYYSQRNYSKALEYWLKALKLDEEGGFKQYAAIVTCNIGVIYAESIKDFPKALEYDFKCLKLYEELGDKALAAAAKGFIGQVYHAQKKYVMSLEYYQMALKSLEEFGGKRNFAVNLFNVGDIYIDLVEDTTARMGSIKVPKDQPEFKDAPTVIIPKGKAALISGAIDYIQRGLAIAKEINALELMRDCYADLSRVYKLKGDYKRAMEYQTNAQALKDSLFSQDNKEQLIRLEMQDQYGRQHLTDSLKTEARERISTLQLQKQRTYTYLGLLGILLLAAFSFFIVKERGKSERLLLNILPSEVAQELKSTGSSKAKHFDDVTVLFTDFVNSTSIGEQMEPEVLLEELNECFKTFEEITNKYGIEKIKTVGDGYHAVAGLPKADPRHAENIVMAAKEISAFMADRLSKLGKEHTFGIRIGVHSGSSRC